MKMEKLNREVLSWPQDHPARQFLEAFIQCRRDCVGREIAFEGSGREAVEQEWISETDGQRWTFSKFAYTFLSYTLILDGWLSGAADLTESERADIQQIPLLRRLMKECTAAALRDRNRQIVELTQQVTTMLELWERCIRSRLASS